MRSVKSSVKGWKTAAARLAVLIVIVVQALGLGAVWPQEPAEPQLDKEFDKQEKIYRSRGADVPRGYVTGRGSRTTRSFFPPASATRSAGLAARTDGWISERATGRPYSTTTPPKTTRRRLKNAPGPAPRRARSRFP